MNATRRDFLKTTAMGVSVSFLLPDLLRGLTSPMDDDRVLVILQLAGGNDPLNTFIPYTDPLYRSSRPTLAVADSSILQVDSRIGFHPALAPLVPLWERGELTFVNNVGFSTLDRSHFHCQDVWQTGEEGDAHGSHGHSGWLGRYAEQYLHHPMALTTFAVGSRVPLGIQSPHSIPAAIQDLATYDVQTDARYPEDREHYLATLRSVYATHRHGHHLEQIAAGGAGMFESIDIVKTLPPPSTTAAYPDTALGRGFRMIGQTLAGGVGTRVVWISAGGFDTHSAQSNTHATLLGDVAGSLAAFQQDLEERGLSDRVVVLAWSEFGRRVVENASAGTDHGKAGTVFLVGKTLKGGTYYGGNHDLAQMDGGDLRTNVDFRSVYWTVIEDFLGKDPLPVLNRRYDNLGFIRKTAAGGRRQRAVGHG